MTRMAARPACLLAGLIGLAAAGGATAAGTEWTVAADGSAVTLYAVKQGVTFDGVFEDFTAEIAFDPARPEAGRVVGTVRTGSFATPDDQNHTYVTGYLEVEEYPEARFESTSITPIPDGFRATGNLTLKGITNPATLDFAFVTATESSGPAARARFTGGMTVNRFDFDIASDVDINFAGRDVYVRVDLELER
jgi:polyisoprenoid-binding protein YceI